MKRLIAVSMLLCLLLVGCTQAEKPAQVAATTMPVYEFTSRLLEGTDVTVTQLVTEQVSCLHDYSLNVDQVKAAEAAEVIVISGAGLEDFMADQLDRKNVIDASDNITVLKTTHAHASATAEERENPTVDSHIWLSVTNARSMAGNIAEGLIAQYPEHEETITANLKALNSEFAQLHYYAAQELSDLSCTKLITFHDGFTYLANEYNLTIMAAIEEESGSEASASELQEVITLIRRYNIPAVFYETNGSHVSAKVAATEAGISIYRLDMAMSGDSWFDAMYHNIDTLKEALG